MWKDAKYLLAYLSPAAAALGFYLGGWWSFGALYVGFFAIPVLELFLPGSSENVAASDEPAYLKRRFFDWMLYLHVPVVYGLTAFYIYRLAGTPLTAVETAGMTLSMGVILGTCAINVAHELGHRKSLFEQILARLLLVPALYVHFTIEHNYGHHNHVGTPEDPATARKGEGLYAFWWRSVTGSWRNAWRLERQLRASASHQGHPFLSLWTGMLLQMAYLFVVFGVGGLPVLLCVVMAAVMGFLLLESVNYIEHYGLTRARLDSGRFEPVAAHHSWNSNHDLGRIFLYELTRHPDHHYRTSRKYQVLRHLKGAPQLPFGYPASLLMAMVPPLWRRVMDRRIPANVQGDSGA